LRLIDPAGTESSKDSCLDIRRSVGVIHEA
jgi:hypothetical protein